MADWQDKLARITQQNRLEIVRAKLSRREMARLGLLTAGGALIAKAGLSGRAFAATAVDDLTTPVKLPPSPPARAWAQAMPRLKVKVPVVDHSDPLRPTGNYDQLTGGSSFK